MPVALGAAVQKALSQPHAVNATHGVVMPIASTSVACGERLCVQSNHDACDGKQRALSAVESGAPGGPGMLIARCPRVGLLLLLLRRLAAAVAAMPRRREPPAQRNS